MQQFSGRRALALVCALAFGTAGSALAQDTTETGRAPLDTTAADTSAVGDTSAVSDTSGVSDTTDTSGVQNPPGYRGMERDTTMFPPEGGPPVSPDRAEDQTTGTYEDSASANQNPPGYRGMERPVEGDSAGGQDTTSVGDTEPRQDDSATRRLDPTDSVGDSATHSPDSTH